MTSSIAHIACSLHPALRDPTDSQTTCITCHRHDNDGAETTARTSPDYHDRDWRHTIGP